MTRIGIIGGFGPGTTAKFYLNLAKIDVDGIKPDLLLHHVPIQYSLELDLLSTGGSLDKYLPHLVNSARTLESGGANLLVMPCNTLHKHIDAIRSSVGIPMLSITQESANHLQDIGIEYVGILATSSTLDNNLYSIALKARGIKVFVPETEYQVELDKIIGRLVEGIITESDREKLNAIINNFQMEGIHDVILACTDLQLLTPSHSMVNIHDSMEILLKSTERYILFKDSG